MTWPNVCPAYKFDQFVLDPAVQELLLDGIPIHVAPKVFDLLTLLINARDRVVPGDELRARLWPNEHVSNGSLRQCIFSARRALGERGSFIRTIHRRGYRFVAPVEPLPAVAGLPAPALGVPPAATASAGRENR